MNTNLALASALLVLSAEMPAQKPGSTVVPAQFSNKAGGNPVFWALSPFPARRQLVIDAKHLTVLKSSSIKGISVRRHVEHSLVAGLYRVQIWLSNTPADPAAPSPSLGANRGPDHVLAFKGTIRTPTLPVSSARFAPWSGNDMISFPLASPFPYTGGNLCIETTTEPIATNNTAERPWYVCDGVASVPANPNVMHLGTSCIREMPGQPAGADAGSVVSGATAVFHLAGMMPNWPKVQYALAVFGSNDKFYGPVRLPADLAVLGAPGCSLYVDWLFTVPATVSAFPDAPWGQASLAFDLPTSSALVGRSLFNQWAVVDIGNNHLGMTFSNGVIAHVASADKSVAVAWIESNDLGEQAVGQTTLGRTPVLRFDY